MILRDVDIVKLEKNAQSIGGNIQFVVTYTADGSDEEEIRVVAVHQYPNEDSAVVFNTNNEVDICAEVLLRRILSMVRLNQKTDRFTSISDSVLVSRLKESKNHIQSKVQSTYITPIPRFRTLSEKNYEELLYGDNSEGQAPF